MTAQPASMEGPLLRATATVTREAASALLAAAREAGASLGFEPATAVVDLGGHLMAFERGDATPYLAGTIATDKAWTAASYQVSTSFWGEYVQKPAVAGLQNSPRVMPVGGGYPLIADGQVIGAIGISGGSLDQDEKAARAAIEQVGLSTNAWPRTPGAGQTSQWPGPPGAGS